ncbi:hypothetical protein TIFTF001_028702 [Ficus carica]|uniref:Uncharacterized protein n=1 Tax=Ficus carica TaxID=3494 RepID=A0AA88DQG2_FICCA|nr:hypothetical protein TIFTF001_028702 [Ficus carica]
MSSSNNVLGQATNPLTASSTVVASYVGIGNATFFNFDTLIDTRMLPVESHGLYRWEGSPAMLFQQTQQATVHHEVHRKYRAYTPGCRPAWLADQTLRVIFSWIEQLALKLLCWSMVGTSLG